MSSWLGQFHDFTEEYDPLGHALVDGAWKSSTKLVNETSRGLVKGGEKLGIDTSVPEYGRDLSQKDKDSFSRWGENTIGAAGLLYGGASALGEGGSSAGGLGSGDGAFLGEGVSSGVPGWDGAAGGMGLDFNPNGMPEGSGLASDFPSMGNSKGGMQMPFKGGQQRQQGDNGAMARQQALADYMRRQREQNEAAAGMPGWVNMSEAY